MEIKYKRLFYILKRMIFDIKKRFLTNKKMLSKMQEIKSCIALKQDDNISALEWKINKKDCPKVPCKNCKLKSSFHPHYIEAEITGCISNSCETIEDVAKRILEFRGFSFLKIDKTGSEPKIFFNCDKISPHEYSLTYENLRRGDGCKICAAENRNRKKVEKIVPVECDCKLRKAGKRVGTRCYICPHYNFQALYPSKSENWDYELNGNIMPYEVAPSTHDEYWFYCPRYNEVYKQALNHRTSHNANCVYCSNKKLCHGNSLLGLYPEFCKEWDPENEIKPYEIFSSYQEEVSWLCFKTDKVHKYMMSPAARTGCKNSGCRDCNIKGYDQLVGGHEFFVKECNKIHENKYIYIGKYINNYTNIDIYCPTLSKSGEVHGIFPQIPSSHKSGAECPKCSNEREESKISIEMKKCIDTFNLKVYTDYLPEHTLPDLIYKGKLSLDVYVLPNVIGNICPIVFERDGMQHMKAIEYWGGKDGFVSSLKRDYTKDKYCLKNKISLIRIPYNIKLTTEYIGKIFDLCKKSQVYMSYNHFINKVKTDNNIDLSNINIINVEIPISVDETIF